MPKSTSFWEHPIDKLEEALSIKKQIAALQEKLKSLFGSDGEEAPASKVKVTKARKGKMSAEGRARIIAAQKARWVKLKGEKPASPTPKAKSIAPTPAATKPAKRTMSAEARAKIAAAARKRWAAK